MEMEVHNNIYIPEDEWTELLKGWLITDVVVRNKGHLSIVAREIFPEEEASLMADHEFKTTVVQVHLAPKPDANRKTGAAFLEGFTRPNIGTCIFPKVQDLLVSNNNQGQVRVLGPGAGFEYISPKELVPLTNRIVTIDGWAYSVGSVRKIYKRTEVGHWEPFNEKGLSRPTGNNSSDDLQIRFSMGFEDMDGPSENHMYAVGGEGEVFFYNGEQWRQCDFPSNEQLSTVTVTPDKTVYIGGEGGNIWRGQADTWEKIYSHTSSVLYNDSVWFDNKLWLSSDYELKTVTGDKVEPAMFGEQRLPFSGHMDARDGLLVIASLHQVYAFDGKQWQCLVSPYE
jgi:hypothetical protein